MSVVGSSFPFDAFAQLLVQFEAGPGVDYRGQTDTDGQPHGVGVLRLASRALYVGQLQRGRAHGVGSLQSDAVSACGEWSDGHLHGLVQLTAAGEASYLGLVSKGRPHGHGEVRLGADDAIVGDFEQGLLEGFGIHTRDGVARKHFFKRGLYDGAGAHVREDADGTESIESVGTFAAGALVREAADARETEAILQLLFHAEQRMFADSSKPLSERWALILKKVEGLELSMLQNMAKRGLPTAAAPAAAAAAAPVLAVPASGGSGDKPRRQRSIGDGRRVDTNSLRAMAQQVLQAEQTPPSSPQIAASARADFKTARADELEAAAGGERRKVRAVKKPTYSETIVGGGTSPSGSPKRARPTSKQPVGIAPLTNISAATNAAAAAAAEEPMTPRRFATMMTASVITVQLAHEMIFPGEMLSGVVHVDIAKGAVLEECKVSFVARAERVQRDGTRTSQRVFRVRKMLVRGPGLRHGLHSLPFSFTTRSDSPPSGVLSAASSRAQTLRASDVADAGGANSSGGAANEPIMLSRHSVSRSLRRVVTAQQAMQYSIDVTCQFAKRPQMFHRQRVVLGEPSLQTTTIQSISRPALEQMLSSLDADMQRECQECERRFDEQIDLLLEAMMVHEVMLLTAPFNFALALTHAELARRQAAQ